MTEQQGKYKTDKAPGVAEIEAMQRLEEAFLELSGADSLADALEQWNSERVAMGELYDQNQALSILNRRLLEALATAGKMIEELNQGDVMFVPQKVIGLASILEAEMKALNKAIAHSKELTDEKQTKSG